jgi:hypothetical protein
MSSPNLPAAVRPARPPEQPERLHRADARGVDQCLARLFFAFNTEPSLEQFSVYSTAVSGYPWEALNAAVHLLARGEGDGKPQFLPTAAEVALECRRETGRIADEMKRREPRQPVAFLAEIIPPGEWARREARVKASKIFMAERDAVLAEIGKAMSMKDPRELADMDGMKGNEPWTLEDTTRRIDELTEQVLRCAPPRVA